MNAGFDQDFKMTAEQLENAITEKTKMLILCSPSNPTGSVYSKEELAALAEVLKKHPEVFVLADEIYEHINYIGKHHSIAQEPGMKEQVIIANGVSKAYAMTGWRIGFPGWSGMDHQGLQQAPGTVYQRYMFCQPEGSRSSLHTRPECSRGNARSFRAPTQPDCKVG